MTTTCPCGRPLAPWNASGYCRRCWNRVHRKKRCKACGRHSVPLNKSVWCSECTSCKAAISAVLEVTQQRGMPKILEAIRVLR
jgi:hypothetical protein